MISPMVTVHTVPLLLDRGFDPLVAAAAFGTLVFMSLPGRLLFGWLGDRVSKERIRYLMMLAYAIETVGLLCLILGPSMAWIWAFLVIYGLGHGAGIMISPPLRGRYWGRKAYATIQGTMSPITMIVGVIAPVYAGWAYDTTGTYMGAFTLGTILMVISIVIMYFCTPPKPPENVGDITDVF